MDDELTPEQRFAAEDAETLVPRALLLGKSPDDIVADLVALDWSLPAARALVERFVNEMRKFNESPENRQRLIDRAFKQFVIGLFLSVLALTLVVMLLLLAIAIRGSLVLVAGALLVCGGSITAAGRGWSRWRLYRGWARQIADRDDTKV